MQQVTNIDLVGALIVGMILLIPGLTAIVTVIAWINRVAVTATGAKESADRLAQSQKVEADHLRERAQDLANQVASFRIEVAREFVPRTALNELRSELLKAITSLTDRIDRVLDNQP